MQRSSESLRLLLDLTQDLRTDEAAAAAAIDVVATAHPAVAPHSIYFGSHTAPFSATAAAAAWAADKDREVFLTRDDDAGLTHWMSIGTGKKRTSRLMMSLPLAPFHDRAVCDAFVGAITALAGAQPCRYGWAHMSWDADLGEKPPEDGNPLVEMHWLDVLGPALVKQLGPDRVRSTPAHHVELLPNTAAVIVTTATPTTYGEPSTASARAQALHHLRPDLALPTLEKRYRERAAALAPVERDWDPDIAKLLEHTLRMEPLDKIRDRERAYNRFRPTVTEWKPASEQPPSDVDRQTAGSTIALHAEGCLLIAQAKLDLDDSDEPSWLEELDAFFWQDAHKYFGTPENIEKVVPPIGAELGEMIADHLDGTWVVRKALEESAVIVGDRAWLPFQRARNYAHSRDSMLQYSLIKFFREVERHR